MTTKNCWDDESSAKHQSEMACARFGDYPIPNLGLDKYALDKSPIASLAQSYGKR